jgi:hypothetical protein
MAGIKEMQTAPAAPDGIWLNGTITGPNSVHVDKVPGNVMAHFTENATKQSARFVAGY